MSIHNYLQRMLPVLIVSAFVLLTFSTCSSAAIQPQAYSNAANLNEQDYSVVNTPIENENLLRNNGKSSNSIIRYSKILRANSSNSENAAIKNSLNRNYNVNNHANTSNTPASVANRSVQEGLPSNPDTNSTISTSDTDTTPDGARTQVVDTDQWPWNAIVQLVDDDQDGYCSGVIIGDNQVLTSAHCVYSYDLDPSGAYYGDITVIPGRNVEADVEEPFGRAEVVDTRLSKRWINNEKDRWDIALLTLDRNIGEKTAKFRIDTFSAGDQAYKSKVHVTGYPGSPPDGDKGTMWDHEDDGAGTAGAFPACFGSGCFWHKYWSIATGGHSGGPVWRWVEGRPTVLSVHKGKYTSGITRPPEERPNIGIRITKNKYDKLTNEWIPDSEKYIPESNKPELTHVDVPKVDSDVNKTINSEITINHEIMNTGMESTGCFEVSYYLHSTGTREEIRQVRRDPDSGDHILDSTVCSLERGEIKDIKESSQLPNDIMPGNYWVSAVIDKKGEVDEYGDYSNDLNIFGEYASIDRLSEISVENIKPTAGVSINTPSLVVNKPITVSSGASSDPDGKITNREWDIDNDGNWERNNKEKISFKLENAGKHTIRLKVTDDEGDTDTESKEITVSNPSPSARFDFSPSEDILPGQSVTFDASSSSDPNNDIKKYTWAFNDGTSDESDDAKISHTYDEPGKYKVALTVTDGNSKDTSIEEVFVKKQPDPANFEVSIKPLPDSITAGEKLEVPVKIENTGDKSGQKRLNLDVTGIDEDNSKSVELNAGDSTEKKFTVPTAEGDYGSQTVEVSIGDDTDDTTITINKQPDPANFEVSIKSLPDSITAGEKLEVPVKIENTGDKKTSQDIRLEVSGNRVDTKNDISLQGDSSQTIKLSYSTDRSDTPDISITVLSDNDSDSEPIKIETGIVQIDASLNTEDITTQAGSEQRIEFSLENTGQQDSAYTLDINIPDGLSVVDHSNDGGAWKQSAQQWTWTTINQNEQVTPSVTVGVPSDANESYLISGKVSAKEKFVAEASSRITVQSRRDTPQDIALDVTAADNTGTQVKSTDVPAGNVREVQVTVTSGEMGQPVSTFDPLSGHPVTLELTDNSAGKLVDADADGTVEIKTNQNGVATAQFSATQSSPASTNVTASTENAQNDTYKTESGFFSGVGINDESNQAEINVLFTTGSLTGNILDQNQNPISDSNVILQQKTDAGNYNNVATDNTSILGLYLFTDINPNKNYRIIAEYRDESESLTLDNLQTGTNNRDIKIPVDHTKGQPPVQISTVEFEPEAVVPPTFGTSLHDLTIDVQHLSPDGEDDVFTINIPENTAIEDMDIKNSDVPVTEKYHSDHQVKIAVNPTNKTSTKLKIELALST